MCFIDTHLRFEKLRPESPRELRLQFGPLVSIEGAKKGGHVVLDEPRIHQKIVHELSSSTASSHLLIEFIATDMSTIMAVSAADLRSPSPSPEPPSVAIATEQKPNAVKMTRSGAGQEAIDVDMWSDHADEKPSVSTRLQARDARSPSIQIIEDFNVDRVKSDVDEDKDDVDELEDEDNDCDDSPPAVRRGRGWEIISEDEESEEEEEVIDVNQPRQTRSARRPPPSNSSVADDDVLVTPEPSPRDSAVQVVIPSSSGPSRGSRFARRRKGPLPPVNEDGVVIRNSSIRVHAKKLNDPVNIFQVPASQAKPIKARHIGPLEWFDVPGIGRTRVHRKYLDQFFYWMAERQRIGLRRAADVPEAMWTNDILFKRPFRHSNCFRQLDSTSIYIMENVLRDYRPKEFYYDDFRPHPDDDRFDADGNWIDSMREGFFRVMLVWVFGKALPYETLLEALGDICLRTFEEKKYADILRPLREAFDNREGPALFGNSFFILTDQRYAKRGEDRKSDHYRRALRHCYRMCTEDGQDWVERERPLRTENDNQRAPGVPGFFATKPTLEECVGYLRAYWGMGDYHSLQLTLHLSYTKWMDLKLEENDWIVGGRGAKNGVSLILVDVAQTKSTMLAGMRWLVSQQQDQWNRLGYKAHIPGVQEGVTIVEVENSLCLWQKYARMQRKYDDGVLDLTRDDNEKFK